MNPADTDAAKIINLMQFARKAGKLVWGTQACLRVLRMKQIALLVIAGDTAPRTCELVQRAANGLEPEVPVLKIANQSEISIALGLPDTGVFGVRDTQFAARMLQCRTA